MRDVGRTLEVDRVHRLPPHRFALGRDLLPWPVLANGAVDDLVVDVGDVRDQSHVEAAPFEVAAQDVVRERRPPVPEVGWSVHRRPAQVDLTPCRARGARARAPRVWRCRRGAARAVTALRTARRTHRPAARHSRRRNGAGTAEERHRAGVIAVAWAVMANIPDKPTLDGIEARWADQWAGRRHLPLRPHRPPATQVFAIDTPPPTVSGSLHVGHVFSYTHTDIVARFQRMRGKAGLLPDRVGRQRARRPSAGSRTTTACAATRRQQYVAGFEPPFRGDAAEGPPAGRRSRGRTSSSSATSWSRSTSRSSRPLFRRLGLSSTGRCLYATIDERSPARQPARVPAQPRPRRGVQPGSADAVGRRLPHRRRPGRDGGPRTAGRVPPDRVPPHRRRRRRRRSTRPGPSCSRRASRSSPIPTTSGTSRCSASTVRTPLYGVEVPIVAHELAQPDKGTGIAMICTFGDTTDVTWWRELALADAADHRPRRSDPADPAGRRRPAEPTRRSPG